MTDFASTLRHYCRNPRCRTKLPSPVANPREAFCTKGCHGCFYLHRCLVCEGPIERKAANQKICRKSKCRSALRANAAFGCHAASSNAKLTSKNPDFIGLNQAPKTDRAWCIIAGPDVSASVLHCAKVADRGEYERIEAKNRAALRAHFAKLAKDCLIQPHHPPVNVVGGYKFPAPVVDLSPLPQTESSVGVPSDWKPCALVNPIKDDLSIPDFLCRTPVNEPLRLAA